MAQTNSTKAPNPRDRLKDEGDEAYAARMKQLDASEAAAEAERRDGKRDDEKTMEVRVAPRRTLSHDGRDVEGGTIIRLPVDEATRLMNAGHVVPKDVEDTPVVNSGPAVYRESGLITGHGAGQGTAPAGKSK